MYYLLKTNAMWGIGGSVTKHELIKKSLCENALKEFLLNEFTDAIEDVNVEFINNTERMHADIEDVEDELIIQYASDGWDTQSVTYRILSDEHTEEISKLKYDLEFDDEDTLISKAVENEELYVCIADQEYVMYVIANSECKAEEIAYDDYCENCFEPGHWKCFKATKEDLDELKWDYDQLLYDEDDFDEGELI